MTILESYNSLVIFEWYCSWYFKFTIHLLTFDRWGKLVCAICQSIYIYIYIIYYKIVFRLGFPQKHNDGIITENLWLMIKPTQTLEGVAVTSETNSPSQHPVSRKHGEKHQKPLGFRRRSDSFWGFGWEFDVGNGLDLWQRPQAPETEQVIGCTNHPLRWKQVDICRVFPKCGDSTPQRSSIMETRKILIKWMSWGSPDWGNLRMFVLCFHSQQELLDANISHSGGVLVVSVAVAATGMSFHHDAHSVQIIYIPIVFR